MSFLDGGGGTRVPTAQSFPPLPSQNAPQPARAPKPPAEELPAFGLPPFNLPAHLKAVATMLEREGRRLDRMSAHPDAWAILAADLQRQAHRLSQALRLIADQFSDAPYPIANKPRTAGVNRG
jgi:hypothetical protein